jgi:hypothetical protein
LNSNRKKFYIVTAILCIAVCSIKPVLAQTENKFDFERIEDNSFLMEEAYNQEAGVIQHISGFQYMNDHTWLYTFTDEWPVPGQKHQLSATIPVSNNSETGFGDVALNYRYQAILMNRFAFSPRFSLLFPTGNYKKGLGAGVTGYQLSLPFSFLLSRKIATHYNLGLTITPNSRDANGTRFDQVIYNYGVSMILLLNKNLNFMLEVVGTSTLRKAPNIRAVRSNTLYINPGIRYAFNFKSGLQIVPGLAAPVGVGASGGNNGVFIYLSFEHPLWRPKAN